MPRITTPTYARSYAALVATLVAVAAIHGMPAPLPPEIPLDVRAVLAADDVPLAFYKGDVTGDGGTGLVLVVYHGPVRPPGERLSPNDPCELIVYEDLDGQWKETSRSDGAVDCINNTLMDRAKPMNYLDELQVTPGTISWSNADIRQHHTFDFSYDKTRRQWYVRSMSQAFAKAPPDPEAPMGLGHGRIESPRDFPLTPMHELDARRLWPVLVEHTTIDL